MKLEINLQDAEITRIESGNHFHFKNKLNSISVTLEIDGFTRDITLKDHYFNRVMEVVKQQVIRSYEDLH